MTPTQVRVRFNQDDEIYQQFGIIKNYLGVKRNSSVLEFCLTKGYCLVINVVYNFPF